MQDLPRHSNDNAEHTSGHTLFVSPYRPYLSPSSSSTITTIIRHHHHHQHHQHHHHHHHRHHHHRGNHQRSHHHHHRRRRRSFHKHHPALQPFCWVRGAMKSPDTRNPKAPEPLPSPLLSYLAHTSTRFPIPKWNPQTRNPKPQNPKPQNPKPLNPKPLNPKPLFLDPPGGLGRSPPALNPLSPRLLTLFRPSDRKAIFRV